VNRKICKSFFHAVIMSFVLVPPPKKIYGMYYN